MFRRRYYLQIVKKYEETDWEWSEVIKPFIPLGGQVLDIGANVGYLSGLFARWVGPEGRVVSIEPIPATYDVLSSSMKRLFPQSVTTFALCVSDRAGEMKMTVPRYKDGGENYYESHIVSEYTPEGSAITVNAITLDDLVHTRNLKPDLIKIDVEGHELSVVQGGANFLSQHHPPLLIEVSGNPDGEDSQAARLFSTLSVWGYKPHLIKNGRLIRRQTGDHSVDYLFLIDDGSDL